MIKPNFDLMMWLIFVSLILKYICQIGLGAKNHPKDTYYDSGDIVAGLIGLAIMAWITFS